MSKTNLSRSTIEPNRPFALHTLGKKENAFPEIKLSHTDYRYREIKTHKELYQKKKTTFIMISDSKKPTGVAGFVGSKISVTTSRKVLGNRHSST